MDVIGGAKPRHMSFPTNFKFPRDIESETTSLYEGNANGAYIDRRMRKPARPWRFFEILAKIACCCTYKKPALESKH